MPGTHNFENFLGNLTKEIFPDPFKCSILRKGKPKFCINGLGHMTTLTAMPKKQQRTIGPENAHLKPDPGVHVLSHHEMTLTLNTHTPLLNS